MALDSIKNLTAIPVRLFATGVLLLALSVISACGQRGDLTLPQEDPKPADTDQQTQP